MISSNPPGSAPLVLIVDDDESLRVMLSTLFRRAGYRVELACDGFDAIERLRALGSPPDAIVSDLAMPGMDGAAFLRVLEHSPHQLHRRLVFYTANEQSAPAGADVVPKGARLTTLLDAIGNVVRRNQSG